MIKGKTQKKITLKKLKGYIAIFRNHLLFLREKKFTLSDLGAYHTFLLTADWDKKHSTFGVILEPKELQEITKIDSTTWSRYRKKFLIDGHFEELESGGVRIANFWIHLPEIAKQLASKNFADMQERDALLQSGVAKMQSYIATLQLPVKQRAVGDITDNAYNSSKTNNTIADLQSQNHSKETLNKHKETLNNKDASHPHSPSLVSREKEREELLQEIYTKYFPEIGTYPKDKCQGCGKEMPNVNVSRYSKKKFGHVFCYYCASPIRNRLRAKNLY